MAGPNLLDKVRGIGTMPSHSQRPLFKNLPVWQIGALWFAIGTLLSAAVVLSRYPDVAARSDSAAPTSANSMGTIRFAAESDPCRQLQIDNRTGRIQRTK